MFTPHKSDYDSPTATPDVCPPRYDGDLASLGRHFDPSAPGASSYFSIAQGFLAPCALFGRSPSLRSAYGSYSYAHGTAVSSSDHSRENGPERAPTRWASLKWLRRRDSNTRTLIVSGQKPPVKRYSNPWTFGNRRRVFNKKAILKKSYTVCS